ncbi:uncharacterized protein ARMOST_07281 [Armillaria ostoyae]|uniref:Uncharacterized protein n=1 Tax=Armillaria ostoyae TaxID=47428 RepID=A0A284R5C7_ARMOS|nr:uncharacterized protein ARMOST_07281 [Armillaria ostoyae]
MFNLKPWPTPPHDRYWNILHAPPMPTVTTANEIELEPSSSTALTNVVNNTENTNRPITNGDVTSSNAFDGTVPSGTEINNSVILAGANAPTDMTIDAAVPNGEEHKPVEQNSGTNVNKKPNEQIVPTTTIRERLPRKSQIFQ